ncbi:MAG: hypothetical protein Greene041619_494 [Candidatus Peregrinibacteria bacterium Greene0416_19]|nr:MAG: hypothetical protein Greene041619_494 [Candidatus Peregrinibacteria bacterium Greene0416_19]
MIDSLVRTYEYEGWGRINEVEGRADVDMNQFSITRRAGPSLEAVSAACILVGTFKPRLELRSLLHLPPCFGPFEPSPDTEMGLKQYKETSRLILGEFFGKSSLSKTSRVAVVAGTDFTEDDFVYELRENRDCLQPPEELHYIDQIRHVVLCILEAGAEPALYLNNREKLLYLAPSGLLRVTDLSDQRRLRFMYDMKRCIHPPTDLSYLMINYH